MSTLPRPTHDRFAAQFGVVGAALIGLAVLLAWSNSLTAPFELDDDNSIANNPSIRQLASFAWLKPPASHGETVSGRPVLNLSFAADYACGGLDVRWFHATNLVIHVVAALLLFGLMRRTLSLAGIPAPWRSRAGGLALVVALIWAVHPLETQAVTYIVQRAESLMSLFYLATLYAFVRAVEGEGEQRGRPDAAGVVRCRVRWLWFAWLACLLGMATKENMVSAPLAVLLFDRAFISGSFVAAWRTRRRFYLGLASTWLLLAALVLSTGGNRGGSAGFDVGVPWMTYVLTQFPALLRYTALSFWPSPLVFEYGDFTVAGLAAVTGGIAFVGGAAVATLYAQVRAPRIGFVAFVAWAILAPTSLVPGTLQMIVEHRMYLPLASIIILVVLTAYSALNRGGGRILLTAAAAVIVALVLLTMARNRVYASELALWSDTALKRPGNPRAHNNLGLALLHAGRTDAAMAEFRRAIDLQPNHAFAHANLGGVLLTRHEWDAAAAECRAALAADPHLVSASIGLGVALAQLGQRDEAIAAYRAALRDDPHAADAQSYLASLLIDRGELDEAEALLRAAVATAPEMAEVRLEQGRIFEHRGMRVEAESEYRKAGQLNLQWAQPHLALGNMFAGEHDFTAAEANYREAIRADPSSVDAYYDLGNVLAQQQRLGEATTQYREALRLDPHHLEARSNLANCELMAGHLQEAISDYEQVLHARPNDARVRQNLDLARQMVTGGTPQ